jgi:hypothetical protein
VTGQWTSTFHPSLPCRWRGFPLSTFRFPFQDTQMIRKPNVSACPECQGRLEEGFVQGQSAGVLWTSDPNMKWFWVFSSKVEKLQKDWTGFPKLVKEKLPALRCRRCRLVIMRYSK